jgi:hypothetical protein
MRCFYCKYYPDTGFCKETGSDISRRWSTCASFKKDDNDEIREEKSQTSEESNRQRIVSLIKANKFCS